ncbi:MAG TPA: transferrin-binding protein-like solute binding protein [Sphingobium sp.]
MNDAGDAAGTFHSDGSPVTSAFANAASSFTVSYNAATQSYTVSTGSRTQTFTPADQVASGSTDFKAFEKSSGNLHESLSLTVPGSSGALQYQYVGGGAWERANLGTTTLDFTYNPFTYGFATADANLARSGTGLFSVSLVGARESDMPYAMAGSGTMQVDFAGSKLSSTGVLTTIDTATGVILSLGVYYGSAQLSSTTNAFTGTFAMDDGTRFTGGWKGRFYGPANEEVGAAWYISSTGGEYASGYLLGRSDNTLTAYNTSIAPLQFSETFAARYSELAFHDNGNGTAPSGSAVQRSDGTMRYDAGTGAYTFTDTGSTTSTLFPAASQNAGASSSSFAVYDVVSGGTSYRLTLLKPGASNPTIQLSYTSFGRWQQAQNGVTDAKDRWFAWGVRTNAFQIPTGTGHYDGILVGKGTTDQGGAAYDLTGTSAFDVNFGAATFTGSLHPIGKDLSTLATRDFGTYSVTGGLMDLDGGLNADIVDGSSNYLGYFEGALYGPNAQEIGGVFGFKSGQFQVWDPGYATAVNLSGAVVGKK